MAVQEQRNEITPNIGNDEGRSVRNGTPADTAPPVVSSVTIFDNLLTLSYTSVGQLGSGAVPASAFRVLVNDAVVAVTHVDMAFAQSNRVMLTLARPVAQGDVVSVSYTKPANGLVIQDTAGSQADSFQPRSVDNQTDISGPVLLTTGDNAPRVEGNQLVLHFTDIHNLGSVASATTAFTVRVNGAVVSNAATGITVDAAAKSVTLTLATAVLPGQPVTVSYTDPGVGNDSNAIQDAIGNDALSFQANVRNLTDTTAPVLDTVTAFGNALTLHYTEASRLGDGAVPASAFRVLVNGAAVAVTNVGMASASNNHVTLTLARPVAQGDTVRLDYTKPASGFVIEDIAGNDADSFQGRAVDNRTDNVPPALVTQGANAPRVDGNRLVLSYTDTNQLGAIGPDGSAFTVRVGDTANALNPVNAVTGVAVDSVAKTVTLTLTTAVTQGQAVTVSYADPSAGNDPRAIQDAAGNDAASFTGQLVTNTTPDGAPPVLVTQGATAPRVNGNQLLLDYTGNLATGAAAPPAAAFTVRVDNVVTAVNAVAVAGKTVTLTLAATVAPGRKVTVSYTDPSSRDDIAAIQDAAGNDAASFANRPVANNTPAPATPPAQDTAPPVLRNITVDGNRLVITYDDASRLDERACPDPWDYWVMVSDPSDPPVVGEAVSGHQSNPLSVAVNGEAKTVTLTLDRPVLPSGTVLLNYRMIASRDPAALGRYIRDVHGNIVEGINVGQVQNLTDHTPPVLVTEGANAPTVDGKRLVLSYTDTRKLDATGPLATAFTVRADGAANTVTGVGVDAVLKTVTLTLATAVTQGQSVTVSYTDPTGSNDANAIQDDSGNDAISFTDKVVTNNTPETTPPRLVTHGADAPTVNGRQLVLHYTDAGQLGATGPAATAFTVRVDGVVNTVTGLAVNAAGKTVTLTLATAVAHGQTVTVSYTDPSGRDDIAAVQDAIGNDAVSFTNQPVTITTPDITPPVLVTTGTNAPKVSGNQLVLHYTDASDLSAVKPLATVFTVRANDVNNPVTDIVVNPRLKTVTLILTTAVTPGQPVTLSYTDPGTGNDIHAIQDAAGNDAASITTRPVTNETLALVPTPTPPTVAADTTSPMLVTTGADAPMVNGTWLVLHYTDADSLAAAGPLATAFTVRVDGAVDSVTRATVNAVLKTVTLTLATAVKQGQVVTVSYTDPTDSNDTNAIQDATGNDAASFAGQTVINDTRDTTAPVLDTVTAFGNTLTLHYTEASRLGDSAVPASAFRVLVNGVAVTVTNVSMAAASNNHVTLTLGSPVTARDVVTLDYTKPAGGFVIEDVAGNDADSFQARAVDNRTDNLPPALVTQGVNAPRVDGNRLVLSYTDANHLGLIGPDGAAFTVRVGDTANALNPVNAVTGVVVDPVAKTVTLTLTTAVTQGQLVTISYTDPSAGNDPRAIQDAADNDAASFMNLTVTNTSPDGTPPLLVTQGATAPRVNGNQLLLDYTDASNLATGAAAPPATAFTVRVDGVVTAVNAVAVAGKTVTLTLAAPVTSGREVTISYTDPSSRNDIAAIQDAAGNDAASFANRPVANNTPVTVTPPVTPPAPARDTTSPVLRNITVDGNRLVITYDDESRLDEAVSIYARTDYVIKVNDKSSYPNTVVVNGEAKTVTLTFDGHVMPGDTVLLSYRHREVAGARRFIHDVHGNIVDSFNEERVQNLTDNTPPVLVTEGANAPAVDGNRLVLSYTDTRKLDATGPLATAFTVRANGTANTVTGVAVDAVAKTVTLTLATAVTQGQRVTVSYTDPSGNNDANAIQDDSGNDAISFTDKVAANNTPGATPPVLVTEGANAPTVDGNRLVLSYTDTGKLHTTGPLATDFTARADGVANTVTGVAVDAVLKTVTLTLATAVTQGQRVTVSYTDPGPGNDVNAIQDDSGNDAASFTDRQVTNNTPESMPPRLVTHGADAPTVNGRQLVLHYTDANHLSATGPDASAFTVHVDGVVNTVTGVTVNAVLKTVTLTLTTAVARSQTVTVGYTDPSGRDDVAAIQDAIGNDAVSFTNQPVTITSPDTAPPVLVTTGSNAPKVNGDRLVLHYTDASDLSAVKPLAMAFTVRSNGVDNPVADVVVNPQLKTVTLILTTAVTAGQPATLSYSDPGTGNDIYAIQDAAGNDAASITTRSVTNDTPAPALPTAAADTTAPVLDTVTAFGNALTLHYTEASRLGDGAVPASAFRVLVNGAAVAVTNVDMASASNNHVTLTLARPVAQGDTVRLDYTKPASGFVIEDIAGNDADSFQGRAVDNRTDNVPPALVTQGANAPRVDGNRLVLSYTDTNQLGAIGPDGSAFTVRVGDTANALNPVNAVTGVAVDSVAKTVTLTLTTAVTQGQAVTVSYADPSAGNDPRAIQDAAGNDAASFTGQLVTNTTPDGAPPVLVTQGATAPRVNGNQLLLDYTGNLATGAAAPPAAAFTVRVDNVVTAVNAVAVAGKTVTLTLAATVAPGRKVTVSYTDPSSRDDIAAIQDAAGNDAASFANRPVANNTPAPATPPAQDTAPPVLRNITVDGNRLVITYDDASRLDERACPDPWDYWVMVSDPSDPPVVGEAVSGHQSNPLSVAVNGEAKTVTLTLDRPVLPSGTVLLNYRMIASRDPAALGRYIRDVHGNIVEGINVGQVQNLTDHTPPVLVTEGANAPTVDGKRLVLSYTDTRKLDATGPLATAFTVRADGAANTVTGVGVDAVLKTVTLTLATAVTQGQSVTVSYTDPTGSNDANAIQDDSGNDAISFTDKVVTNNTPETTPPRLVTHGADAPTVNGRQLVLHYTDAGQLGATGPAATAFTVRVDGVVNTVTGLAVNAAGKTVTLTLATAVTHGQAVTVSYTDPTSRDDVAAIQDAAGNDAASFPSRQVINITPDTTPPVLVATGANAPKLSGDRLVLHYTDASDLSTVKPLATAFTVRSNGVSNPVTDVVVNPQLKTVTLILTTAVTAGQPVTLSYTDPGTGNDIYAIQDAAGNDAASITSRPVTNNTPTSPAPAPVADTTPPVLVIEGANAPRVNGNRLLLDYTDANDLGAGAALPRATAFTVRVDNAVIAVSAVAVAGKTVTLTLAAAVTAGQDVRISYTDPSPGNDASAIQDAADNDAASFPDQFVTNTTPASAADTTPPALVAEGADAPTVNGTRLVLHYTDANNLGAAGPAAADFAVLVNGAPNVVANAVVDPVAKIVILTLTTAVTPGQTVRISYTDPSAGNDPRAIQDAAGNDAVSFADQLVTNNSTAPTTPTTPVTPDTPTTPVTPPPTDTAPPVLESATINGDRLVLTYTDANNLGAGAAAPRSDAFTVRVKGHEVAVSSVTVTGKTVTLILAAPVWPGQPVTVSYTDPSAANDPSAIQDAAGNDAISLTDQLVTNNTTVTPTEPDPVTPVTPPVKPVTPSPESPPTPPTTVTPSPTPATPPSSPRTLAPDDNDSVPGIEEDKIPGITGPGGAAPLAGDGNGDGIKDSQQSAVASMNGMTLVAGSHDGKPPADSNVRIAAMEQQAAPANLPKGLEMPMGLLRFETTLAAAAGSLESFSLYVDPTRGANGYWVRDDTGVWVNLASEPYGGKTVTEGGRLRLDFKITDGGAFDADGKADGLITTLGAAGHAQLSIVGQTPDLAQGGFWF